MSTCLRHYILTAETATQTLNFGSNIFSAYFRCPITNTGFVYVMIDQAPCNATEGTSLGAGETLSIDIGQALQVIAQRGETITQDKFIRFISYNASAAAQTLTLEVLEWV